MKLSDLKEIAAASEHPSTVTIYQPNGDPYRGPDGQPCTITHTGKESRAYKEATEARDRRLIRKRKVSSDPKDWRRNRVDIAAAVVTGWSGWTEEDETTPLPATRENVRALLAYDHILEQLEASIEEHDGGDFFTTSSAS